MLRLFNEQLPSIFNDFYFDESTNYFPKTKINKEKSGYNVNFALPGLEKDDVNIKVNDGVLTVSLSEETKSDKSYFISKFSKSYNLPTEVDVDKIKGKFKDGILTVDLPFRDEAIMEKVIEIT
jgi:HSP20 family protein